jgi:hypothetical protein
LDENYNEKVKRKIHTSLHSFVQVSGKVAYDETVLLNNHYFSTAMTEEWEFDTQQGKEIYIFLEWSDCLLARCTEIPSRQ